MILEFIPEDEFFDMPTLFKYIINNDLKSISFPIKEYWIDIGREQEYKKANNEYKDIF